MPQVPIVDYLSLAGDAPRLVANECTSCGARFFDRRNACAACGAQDFVKAPVAVEGVVRTFTLVSHAAPGITVPFAACVVDCGGTSVRGNIVNTPADAEHIAIGMKVRLTTYVAGTDTVGTEAIGFAFEPIEVN